MIRSFKCKRTEALYRGETVAEILAAAIEREPDWQALPQSTPPAVLSLLRRCLRKDPQSRLRDIGDARIELEDALVASVRLARAEPERLAYESSERYGYPPGFLARYFEKLRYSFGPRERAGLLTFLELARDVGELDEVPELRFVSGGVTV